MPRHDTLLTGQGTAAYSTGVAGYYVAIGTYEGGQDLLGRRSVGDATEFVLWNASLAAGQTYYASVWARDYVGLEVGSRSLGPPFRICVLIVIFPSCLCICISHLYFSSFCLWLTTC